MSDLVGAHLKRLRFTWVGFAGSLIAMAALATLLGDRPVLLSQGEHLLWAASFLALLNFVTLMPIYRAMLAKPRRVFAVSHLPAPLLHAHFLAHAVALARVAALGVLGLGLLLLSGEEHFFWFFDGAAGAATLILWPRADKVRALVEVPALPASLAAPETPAGS